MHKASLRKRIPEIRLIRRLHDPICFHRIRQRKKHVLLIFPRSFNASLQSLDESFQKQDSLFLLLLLAEFSACRYPRYSELKLLPLLFHETINLYISDNCHFLRKKEEEKREKKASFARNRQTCSNFQTVPQTRVLNNLIRQSKQFPGSSFIRSKQCVRGRAAEPLVLGRGARYTLNHRYGVTVFETRQTFPAWFYCLGKLAAR